MKIKKGIGALLLLFTTLVLTQVVPTEKTTADSRQYGVDLAYGRRVVSSAHTDNNTNTKAVDADPNTRFAAVNDHNGYFYVDLGSLEKVGKVVIDWESAYAKQYQLQMSLDALNWTAVATVEKDNAHKDEIVFPQWIETKFVKFQGVEQALNYGYSFYSFEVYGPRSLGVDGEVSEVSSYENELLLPASAMTDNLAHTRWASSVNDNQHILFDFHNVLDFDLIKIRWEVSFARIFEIYGHDSLIGDTPARDDSGWYYITGSDVGLGEVDTLPLAQLASSRFIKVELIQRETNETTKKTGRYPWESTFSIYSFELFSWNVIPAAKLGKEMEFSVNSPAWVAMSNITLFDEGLLLAPQGYPIDADGKVTNMASIADGNIPGFESYATYNPAVIFDEERNMFHMIYRSELPDNFTKYFGPRYELGHMSTLSYASSPDGKHFTRGENNPIAWPTLDDEKGGGMEDPRMFKIVNDPNRDGKTTYYITYTMYEYEYGMTREGLIYTHDFETYHKVGRLAPNYGGAYKSGSYITDPEGNAVQIPDPRPGKRGLVYMIYMKDGGYTRIGFTNDVIHINAEDIIDIDTTDLGNNDIEALTKGNESCMAITNIYGPDDQDIYLMYGGGVLSDPNIQHQQANANGWFYALGVLKTTKANPFELMNVRLDLDEPTMYPTDTNKIDYGLFDKCMFTDSLIRHNNEWLLYYGAGDMYVGLAVSRADFSAGASSYQHDGQSLTASTKALNKAYEGDFLDRQIEYVLEVFDLDGRLLATHSEDYEIAHFTKSVLGKYDRGIDISVTINLDNINELPDNFYTTSYVRDKDTQEMLNNVSYYLQIDAVITHAPR